MSSTIATLQQAAVSLIAIWLLCAYCFNGISYSHAMNPSPIAPPIKSVHPPSNSPIKETPTQSKQLQQQNNVTIQTDLTAAAANQKTMQPTLLILTPTLGQLDKTKALSNTADFLAKDLANALRIRLKQHQVMAYTDALPIWQQHKILAKAQSLNKRHMAGELLPPTEWTPLANSLKQLLPGATIDRLIMVEAEVDFSKPYQPQTKAQNFLHYLTEIKPTDALDVWLVHFTVYDMYHQPYEPIYRWQYRTTIPADRLTSVFPQVEANRSTIPWLVQASREVETAFLKQVPFEVLNDEWATINTAKGWNKSYRSRTFKEKVNLLQKELSDKPSR
jgi:hypothetical protein